jgi:hypothetical protein
MHNPWAVLRSDRGFSPPQNRLNDRMRHMFPYLGIQSGFNFSYNPGFEDPHWLDT